MVDDQYQPATASEVPQQAPPPQVVYVQAPASPVPQPSVYQRTGTSTSRVRMSPAWHAGHITLTFLTGGLWGIVYLIKYLKVTSVRHQTTHN